MLRNQAICLGYQQPITTMHQINGLTIVYIEITIVKPTLYIMTQFSIVPYMSLGYIFHRLHMVPPFGESTPHARGNPPLTKHPQH
jgi:hypothetical protein